ncbi:MAG: hypothetical protein IPJ19_11650 [Planctomycetes bacterium]|nr:hypothetical protein [Planctomycetota bacterium]
MQFQKLTLGGPDLLFASTNTARLPFQFADPVQGVYALLQGVRLEHEGERGTYYSGDDSDQELKAIEVSLLPIFDSLQSNTTGQVQIHFSLPGSGSPDLVRAEIHVLLIGV